MLRVVHVSRMWQIHQVSGRKASESLVTILQHGAVIPFQHKYETLADSSNFKSGEN